MTPPAQRKKYIPDYPTFLENYRKSVVEMKPAMPIQHSAPPEADGSNDVTCVKCFTCGKQVSTFHKGIVFRGIATCPECIAKDIGTQRIADVIEHLKKARTGCNSIEEIYEEISISLALLREKP